MKKDLLTSFRSAVKLRDEGKLHAARDTLRICAEMDPDSAVILATLGHVYYDMLEFEEASNLFKRAVELSPYTEAYSLGLFHSLWKLEKTAEAIEEAKRFQGHSESEDYAGILKDVT
jgi:tetratricopeptide (TPR) repeat protein